MNDIQKGFEKCQNIKGINQMERFKKSDGVYRSIETRIEFSLFCQGVEFREPKIRQLENKLKELQNNIKPDELNTHISFVPDGYYPNGEPKPCRNVIILELNDKFAKIKYIDTKEIATCPVSTINFGK